MLSGSVIAFHLLRSVAERRAGRRIPEPIGGARAPRRAQIGESCANAKGLGLNGDDLSEMGPIDYVLVEWPGRQPNGEVAPHLVDLVDRGLIRILDLAFIAKGEDGSVAGLEIADVGGDVAELAVFEGAASGLLSDEDVDEAGRRPRARHLGRPAGLREHLGRARSPAPCAAPAASWSPAAASPSKPSSPPSTRPRR